MSELVSTRDPEQNRSSYTDGVIDGLASHGGLYIATHIPELSDADIQAMASMPYPEQAAFIKGQFVTEDEIPHDEILRMMRTAYDLERYPHTIDGIVTPLRRVGDTDIYIQNLSLGPTGAFKDMAMQPLGQEFQYLLQKLDRHLRILAATSGDTGPSAMAALKNLERLSIAVLSPYEGMSKFQWAQAGVLSGGNVVNISGMAPFDPLQDLVKKMSQQQEFADLGAVNSINWSRVTSQIPYYFSAYLQAIEQAEIKFGDEVDIVVPSGNFGNVLAGYYAKKMGLPIRNLVIATNENNVLDELVQTGEYRNTGSRITSSPSMDIAKASNFERVVYEIFDHDPVMTARFMGEFETSGNVTFATYGIPTDIMKSLGFESDSSSHTERLQTMKWMYLYNDRDLIDPHTADAVTVARRLPQDGVPKICMETALPVKFEETVRAAIGFVPARTDERFLGLESRVPHDAFIIMQDVSVGGLTRILRDWLPKTT